jgi:hypothetical protein
MLAVAFLFQDRIKAMGSSAATDLAMWCEVRYALLASALYVDG